MSTFFYMLLAFVVGILVGWFIWGRLRAELDSLRGDLDRSRSERDKLRADGDRLKGELDACGRARADLESRLRDAPAAKAGADKAATPAPATAMSTPAAKSATAKAASAKSAPAKKPAATKTAAASKPVAKAAAPKKAAAPAAKKASAPRVATGKADNLRRLIGIGPVNEKLLKGQGVTSYAQIAAWTAADVKRIEEVLNFDGRVAREKWIEQAKLLAAGDEAEFARRFPTAGTASNT
ncbi:Predicted 5' DNA nuclease, flap endonuclease-1-like, helix-3-turn-helix (H3TH) domain [Mesorhizobium sp. NFR06]|uniref:proton-conducting membrane transporter n=1 Tax=Mesorhizobium sp. NFR06 TaxID=1566290 RepID=UPI0008EA545E|nr:proton-conducting membrane transporter [Mesorhizobium sp. NFR06]SFO13624.1 Predicted 5' DNA nuclease, flap endonuclease-1-like, helix-3-turn-helix (H3TH) domain [Mesorhizobium sp. NFR06]